MASYAAAMRLFTIMDLKSMLQATLESAVGGDPEMLVKVVAIMAKVDGNALVDVAIEATANVFTENEIEGLISFYESAVGTAVMRKLPQFQALIGPAIVSALEGMDL